MDINLYQLFGVGALAHRGLLPCPGVCAGCATGFPRTAPSASEGCPGHCDTGSHSSPNIIDAAHLEKALLECVGAVVRQRPTLLVPILEMWRRLFKVAAQMLETEFQDARMWMSRLRYPLQTHAHLALNPCGAELQVHCDTHRNWEDLFSQTRSTLGARTGKCQFGTLWYATT